MAIIDLNMKCLIVQLWNIKDWLEDLLGWLQGNARRVHERGCGGNGYFGKLSKIGLAPLLWCIIIVLIFVYIHAIILGILLLWYISDDWIFHNVGTYFIPYMQETTTQIWLYLLGYFHGWVFFLQLLDWLCFIDAAGRHLIIILARKEKLRSRERNLKGLAYWSIRKSLVMIFVCFGRLILS